MGSLLERAVNPRQYDSQDLRWVEEGRDENSPTRTFFWHFLSEYAPSCRDKDLLDIGSGTGWLLNLANIRGAKSVLGIDPSLSNVDLARQNYPNLTTLLTSLEEFNSNAQFDIATSIMSIVHILDLQHAFDKVRGLLRPNGEFIAIVPDFEYSRRERRKEIVVEYEILNDEEFVVQVNRPYGVIADVIRTMERYRQSAGQAGLDLVMSMPMPPTELLMQQESRYAQHRGNPISHLLRFKAA